MCERKHLSFFDDLRRLASSIEQGTADLQRTVSSADKGGHSVTAKHQLQTICKEAKDLKHEVEGQRKNVQDESQNFVSTLTACLNLVKTEIAATESTEEFLAQYGYTTWREHTRALNELADASVSAGSLQADRGEGEMTQNLCDPDDMQETDESGNSERLDRTPKLENFTLSSHTMAILAKIRQGDCSSFTNNVHTTSTACLSSNFDQRKPAQMTPLTLRYGTEPMVSPTPFRHSGIIVTPSLMSGFPMPDQTPYGQEGAVYCRDKYASPSPPTFKTPSFKQIIKPGVGDPSYPLPNQPVFDDIEPGVTASPVPPVFITPGVKQIPQKHADDTNDEHNEEAGCPGKKSCARSGNSLFGNTPEAPVFMTPGMKPLPALTDYSLMLDDSEQTIALENTRTLNWQPRSSVNSPRPPIFQAMGAKQIYQTNPVCNPNVAKIEMDSATERLNLMPQRCDLTPQRPELTSRIQLFSGITPVRLSAAASNVTDINITHSLQQHRKGTPPDPRLICSPAHTGRAITPPQPSLLTSKPDYSSKTNQAPTVPVPLTERNSQTDLPAPPVFLRKYDFQQRSVVANGADENVNIL